jgi:hypothetical protein
MESNKLECPRPGTGNPQAEPMTIISAIQEPTLARCVRFDNFCTQVLNPGFSVPLIVEQKAKAAVTVT